MTTVAHSDKRGPPSSSAAPMQNKKEDNSTPIPEIVEERRKDADGRYVVVNRYTRGKLLGKVSDNSLLYIELFEFHHRY